MSQLGHTVGVHRGYFLPSSLKGMFNQVRDDHAVGRMPLVSTKVPDTWANMAAGRQDPWLRSILTQLAADGLPVLLTLHHEPENDATGVGMAPQDLREIYDHAVDLAATTAPNVTLAQP